jgi:hypothetical protein
MIIQNLEHRSFSEYRRGILRAFDRLMTLGPPTALTPKGGQQTAANTCCAVGWFDAESSAGFGFRGCLDAINISIMSNLLMGEESLSILISWRGARGQFRRNAHEDLLRM